MRGPLLPMFLLLIAVLMMPQAAQAAACPNATSPYTVSVASQAPGHVSASFQVNPAASKKGTVAGMLWLSNSTSTPFLFSKSACSQSWSLASTYIVPPATSSGPSKVGFSLSIPTGSGKLGHCVWGPDSQLVTHLVAADMLWQVFFQEHIDFVTFGSDPKKFLWNVLKKVGLGQLDLEDVYENIGICKLYCQDFFSLNCAAAASEVFLSFGWALTKSGAGKKVAALVGLKWLVDSVDEAISVGENVIDQISTAELLNQTLKSYLVAPGKITIELEAQMKPVPVSNSTLTLKSPLAPHPVVKQTYSKAFIQDPCGQFGKVQWVGKQVVGGNDWTVLAETSSDIGTIGASLDFTQFGYGDVEVRVRALSGSQWVYSDPTFVSKVPPSASSQTNLAVVGAKLQKLSTPVNATAKVKFVLKNTGTSPWPAGLTWGPMSGKGYFDAAPLPSIAPGASHTVELSGKAPAQPDIIAEVFQATAPGQTYGALAELSWSVTTTPTPEVVSVQITEATVSPKNLTPPGKALVQVLVRNTGNAPLGASATELVIVDQAGAAIASPFAHPSWATKSVVGKLLTTNLAPGKTAELSFPLSIGADALPGAITLRLRLRADGKWLPGGGPTEVQLGLMSQETTLAALPGEVGFPKVKIVKPTTGDRLVGGSVTTVAFSVAGGAKPAVGYASFSSDGGKSWADLGMIDASKGTFNWNVPAVGTELAKLSIIVESDKGYNASDQTVGVFEIAPACTVPPPVDLYINGSVLSEPSASVWCGSSTGASTYRFELATDGNFANSALQLSSTAEARFEGLVSGTYYFRVRAENSCGASAWSNVVSVDAQINKSPFTPHSPNPPSGTQGVSLDKVLSWAGGDSDGGSVQYQVLIGESPSNLELSLGWKDDQTSHIPYPPLQPEKTYYWMVRSRDDGKLISDGPVWSFKTANQIADLEVKIDAVTGEYEPHGSMTVHWTARNLGSLATKGTWAALYLSKTAGAKQQLLTDEGGPIPALQPGQSVSLQTVVEVDHIHAGPAWIDLWADTGNQFQDASWANQLSSFGVEYDDTIAPTITQTNVAGWYKGTPGAYFKTGQEIKFVAFGSDDTGIVSMGVEWAQSSGGPWTPLVQNCKSDAGGKQTVCDWIATNALVGTSRWFRMTVSDASANTASDVFGPVTVADGSIPVAQVVAPSSTSVVNLGGNLAVEWVVSSPNELKEVAVWLYTDQAFACGSCGSEHLGTFKADSGKLEAGSLNYKVPSTVSNVSSAAKIKLYAWDKYGSSAIAWSEPFVIKDTSTSVPPWSLPVSLSMSSSVSNPACSVAPDGKAQVVYAENGYADSTLWLHGVDGAMIDSAVAIGTVSGSVADHLAVATGPDGKTVVAFAENQAALMVIDGALGNWAAKKKVSPADMSTTVWPTAAAGSKGRVVCWADWTKAVWCASAAGAFLNATKILDDSTYPNLTVDKDGNFLLFATGASSVQLKIAKLDAGLNVESSQTSIKGGYTFWRPAVSDSGSLGVVHLPWAGIGESKQGALFFPVSQQLQLGAMEWIEGFAPSGGAGQVLTSDSLGRWSLFSRAPAPNGDPTLHYSVRSAAGWSVPLPILPKTEWFGSIPAICRLAGKDRIHIFYTGLGLRYMYGSPAADTSPPVLQWSEPQVGTRLNPGEVTTLAWTTSDQSATSVRLEWSKGGPDATWTVISDDLPASGSLPWTVPAVSSGQITFRATATDTESQSTSLESGPFWVTDQESPTVQITSPLAGEAVAGGQKVVVGWEAKDNVMLAMATIMMTLDGGVTWMTLAEVPAEESSAVVDLPQVATNHVSIRVVVTDEGGLVGLAELGPLPYSIPNTPPVAPYNPTPDSGASGSGMTTSLGWLSHDADLGQKLVYDVWFAKSGSPLTKVAAGLTETSFTLDALLPGATYEWRVEVSDGVESVAGPVWTFSTVVPAPDGPTGLTVLTTTPLSVTLGWGGPTDGVVSIERAAVGGETYTELAKIDSSAGSWTDKSVSAQTSWQYRLRRQVGSAWSDYSASVQATTGNSTPDVPQLLMPQMEATGVDPQQITLSWSATDTDGDSLVSTVYLGRSTQIPLWASEVSGTSLAVDDLAYSSVYFWRVVVSDSTGASAQSAVGSFVTGPPPVPDAPTNLVAKLVDDELELSWDDNSTVEAGFRVEWQAGGSWIPLVNTSWSILTVGVPVASQSVSLRVRAFNEAGESDPSNVVQIEPESSSGSDAGVGDAVAILDAGDSAGAADNDGDDDADSVGDDGSDGDGLVEGDPDAEWDALATEDQAAESDTAGSDVVVAQPDSVLDVVVPDGSEAETSSAACQIDGDCDDGNPCTIDVCKLGVCGHATVFACCKSDEECSSEKSCVDGACKVLDLCAPCQVDADCGTSRARCVSFGSGDSGCLRACGAGQSCSSGSDCQDLGGVKTCVPKTASCKCVPTEQWTCTADGKAKVLLDTCGGVVPGTEVACSLYCSLGVCEMSTQDATGELDALGGDAVELDVLDASTTDAADHSLDAVDGDAADSTGLTSKPTRAPASSACQMQRTTQPGGGVLLSVVYLVAGCILLMWRRSRG